MTTYRVTLREVLELFLQRLRSNPRTLMKSLGGRNYMIHFIALLKAASQLPRDMVIEVHEREIQGELDINP